MGFMAKVIDNSRAFVLFVYLTCQGVLAQFSTVAITVTDSSKYAGGAAIGTKAYFAPYNQQNVGIYDVTAATFSVTANIQGGSLKYKGAAAVGTKVIFAPHLTNWVGIYDVDTAAWNIVTATGASGMGKYDGAATVGTKVIFAPCYQNNVGIFDVATSAFTTMDNTYLQTPTDSFNSNTQFKYSGAAAVGTRVFFAPNYQYNMGIYDVTANTFSSVATGLASAAPDKDFFSGAVSVGTKAYFAGNEADFLGIYDAVTNVWSTVATTGEEYAGAAAIGNTVYFAPGSGAGANVGIYDTSSGTFSTGALTGDALGGNEKYYGAVAIGNYAYFVPYEQDNIGRYTPPPTAVPTAAPTAVPTAASAAVSSSSGSISDPLVVAGIAVAVIASLLVFGLFVCCLCGHCCAPKQDDKKEEEAAECKEVITMDEDPGAKVEPSAPPAEPVANAEPLSIPPPSPLLASLPGSKAEPGDELGCLSCAGVV